MGLFTRFRRMFNKNVSILPHQRNDMVSFVKLKGGMLKIGSEIVVDENFNFVIVHFNKVCDVLRSGTYKVDEINTPKLFKYSKAFFSKKGMFTPKSIVTDAYYINLKPFRLNTFKTPERIIAYNKDEKIKLKLEGTFTLRVVDSEKVMRALCNDYAVISNRKAMKEIKATIGFDVSKILNNKDYSLDDYLNNKEKIVETINNEINKYIEMYGLEASEFFVNAVIFPKKNVVDKAKEETLKQENNIDIVKLVEERLNSLENNFSKVEMNKNSSEEVFSNVNTLNTTINKQGDVRVDVSNVSETHGENNNVFTMPYSSVPNTQMFNAGNQVEPKIFEEELNEEENKTNNQSVLRDENKQNNIEENNDEKTSGGQNNVNVMKEDNEEVVNNVVDYFMKQRSNYAKFNKNNFNDKEVKIGKERAEEIISINSAKTKKCKNCGTYIEEDAKFCSKCGKSTEELVICACCGAKNFPTAKTCCVCKSDL